MRGVLRLLKRNSAFAPYFRLLFFTIVCSAALPLLTEDNALAKLSDKDIGIASIQMQPNAQLGRVGDLPLPEDLGVLEFGLAQKVKQKLTYDGVITQGANLVFSSTILKEIVWYAQFSIRGSFRSVLGRHCSAEWYAPDGKLYYVKSFKVSMLNTTFIKTKIKFTTPFKSEHLGVWRVRIFKANKIIDDRYFEIV